MTTQVPGVRGFAAAKNIKGRKRHLLVDTLGLLLSVAVTAASVQERDMAHGDSWRKLAAGVKSCAAFGLMVAIAALLLLTGSRAVFASSYKWSYAAKNSLALLCCRVGGSSSGPSRG